MSKPSPMRLTTLLFYNPGAVFLDTMLDPAFNTKDWAALISRAKQIAEHRGAELIMARWDNPKINVYLADTGKIYRGEEATRIFRQGYRVDVNTSTRPIIPHSFDDNHISAERMAEAERLANPMTDRGQREPTMSLHEIAEALDGLVTELKAHIR